MLRPWDVVLPPAARVPDEIFVFPGCPARSVRVMRLPKLPDPEIEDFCLRDAVTAWEGGGIIAESLFMLEILLLRLLGWRIAEKLVIEVELGIPVEKALLLVGGLLWFVVVLLVVL